VFKVQHALAEFQYTLKCLESDDTLLKKYLNWWRRIPVDHITLTNIENAETSFAIWDLG